MAALLSDEYLEPDEAELEEEARLEAMWTATADSDDEDDEDDEDGKKVPRAHNDHAYEEKSEATTREPKPPPSRAVMNTVPTVEKAGPSTVLASPITPSPASERPDLAPAAEDDILPPPPPAGLPGASARSSESSSGSNSAAATENLSTTTALDSNGAVAYGTVEGDLDGASIGLAGLEEKSDDREQLRQEAAVETIGLGPALGEEDEEEEEDLGQNFGMSQAREDIFHGVNDG